MGGWDHFAFLLQHLSTVMKERIIFMNIMRDIAHRPWLIPSNKWIMRQPWRHLLFTHWRIPAETLRPHIPPHLEIDTFNGYAWLGVIVFVMEGIYLVGFQLYH